MGLLVSLEKYVLPKPNSILTLEALEASYPLKVVPVNTYLEPVLAVRIVLPVIVSLVILSALIDHA